MLNESQISQTSLVDSLKSAIQPENIANKLGIDKNTLIDIGIYGAIGFIIGFLLKKYSEYFIALVLILFGVAVLQHFDYVSVSFNMQKIHEILGLQPGVAFNDGYSALAYEWIKSNVGAVASFVVSFLIGLKVG